MVDAREDIDSPPPFSNQASRRRRASPSRGSWRAGARRRGSAYLVSGIIHLHLWASGYRNIPKIGPLFLVQGVFGIILFVAVSLIRRVFIAVLGALFAAGTIAGLLVSVHFGPVRLPATHELALGEDLAHHRVRGRRAARDRWRVSFFMARGPASAGSD